MADHCRIDAYTNGCKLGDIAKFNRSPFIDTTEIDDSFTEAPTDNILADTEVLCHPDYAEHAETRLVDGCETLIVPDSDDEETHSTETLMHNKTSYSGIVTRHKGDSLGLNQESYSTALFDHLGENGTFPVSAHALKNSVLTANMIGEENDVHHDGIQTDVQASTLRTFKHLMIFEEKDIHQYNDGQSLNEQVNCGEKHNTATLSRMSKVTTFYTRKKMKQFKSKDAENKIRSPVLDQDDVGLDYFGSPAPGELSQANALHFVDQYLSNIVGMSPKGATASKAGKKSSDVSNAIGFQSLAQLANSKKRERGPEVFEWIETHEGKGQSDYFSKGIRRRLYAMGTEKNDSLTFNGGMNDLGFINTHKAVQVTEDPPILQLGDNAIGKDAPDDFDVGFNTQLAAEAIEALSHAAPANWRPIDSDQQSHNVPAESGEGAEKRTFNEHFSFPRRARSRSKAVRSQLRGSGWIFESDSRNGLSEESACKSIGNTRQFSTSQCWDRRNFVSTDQPLGTIKFRKKRNTRGANQGINFADFKQNLNSTVVKGEQSLGKMSLRRVTHSETPSNTGGMIQQIGAIAELRKFDVWNYPKGKRTHKFKRDDSNGSHGSNAPVTVANSEEREERSHGSSQRSLISSSFCLHTNRKKHSSVYVSPSFSSSMKLQDSNSLKQNAEQCCQSDTAHSLDSVAKSNQITTELAIQSETSLWNIAPQTGPDHDKSSQVDIDSFPNENLKPDVSDHAAFPNCTMLRNETYPANLVGGHLEQRSHRKASVSPLTRELIRLGFAQSMPEFTSKDLRRHKTITSIQVLLSQNLDHCIYRHQKKIMKRLGISVASCPSDATHFVTNKFLRTRNMLEFIARGKPVVTHRWLERCEQAGVYIDEREYILKDVEKEKELGFKLNISLSRAREHPLLKGYKVIITPNAKPGQDVLTALVTAANGQLVDTIWDTIARERIIPNNLLILSCEDDYADCAPFLQKGATVSDSELLLNGIIIQKLEFEKHKLFANNVQRY